MKKWEDIVKERMEEPGGVLPESVFDEFHARLDSAAPARRNRFPLSWFLIPAAVAGIAAVLLLLRPVKPDAGMQIIQQPTPPVAISTDSAEVLEPVQGTVLVAQAVESAAQATAPAAARRIATHTQATEIQGDTSPLQDNAVEGNPAEENIKPDTTDISARDDVNVSEGVNENISEEVKDNSIIDETDIVSSPFVPNTYGTKPLEMKVSHAAAIVAGSGLIAGLAQPLFKLLSSRDYSLEGDPVLGSLKPTAFFPVKAGISTRIPLSDRLYLTPSLEYSMYYSTLNYSLAGLKKQHAHYLGVPVRLDWTLASNKWLDVYVGGGLEGSYCLGATQNGVSVPAKDGFGLSLIGAGGIQFNMTKNIGIYIEPELNLILPPDNQVLLTYRSSNPIMFSVGGGIRYTFRR